MRPSRRTEPNHAGRGARREAAGGPAGRPSAVKTKVVELSYGLRLLIVVGIAFWRCR